MVSRWKFTAGSFLDRLEFDDRQDLGDGNTFLCNVQSIITDQAMTPFFDYRTGLLYLIRSTWSRDENGRFQRSSVFSRFS